MYALLCRSCSAETRGYHIDLPFPLRTVVYSCGRAGQGWGQEVSATLLKCIVPAKAGRRLYNEYVFTDKDT